MRPDVQAWLAAPADFAAGAALYAAHGSSRVYQQLFARGETSYSRQLLVQALRALLEVEDVPRLSLDYLAEQRRQLSDRVFAQQVLNVPEMVPTEKPAQRNENIASPAETYQAAPETESTHLADVRQHLKALRDERSHLHAQLTAPRLARKDRLRTALRILDVGDEVLAAEQRLAYVQAHGRLPPGPVATADVTDAGELRRRLDNLVALRSKVRRRPDRAAELPQIEADIQLIREKLTVTAS